MNKVKNLRLNARKKMKKIVGNEIFSQCHYCNDKIVWVNKLGGAFFFSADHRVCCAYGKFKQATVDHVIPIKAGGTNKDNLVPSCMHCNYGKELTELEGSEILKK